MISVNLNSTSMMEMGDGLRVCFPVHSAAGAAATATVWMELDPGGVLPEHRDSAEELLLVIEGEVQASIGTETAILREGELGVVPAMVPHGLRNDSAQRARVLGFFGSSTNVATFSTPRGPEGLRVFVIGAPLRLAVPFEESPSTVK